MRTCYQCSVKEREYFKIVNDYLRDNKNSSIEQVVEETEVPKPFVVKFVKEGRIKTAQHCKKCGVLLDEFNKGIFCGNCSKDMEKDYTTFKKTAQSSNQIDNTKLLEELERNKKYGFGKH